MTLIDQIRFELQNGEGSSPDELNRIIEPLLTELENTMSGSIQSNSVTFSTDPDTFEGRGVIDLGSILHIAYLTAVVTAIAPDGETFGLDPGNLVGDRDFQVSPDGVSWSNISTNGDSGLITTGDSADGGGALVHRYVRFWIGIFESDFNTPYAGSNHPVISAQFNAEWR